jgi:peroxiredoxin (alkyl hydroperoxide reductase subunit C)
MWIYLCLVCSTGSRLLYDYDYDYDFKLPSGLRPRMRAPEFKGTAVVGSAFKKISSKDFPGKYLVLLFYPFDFTFVCPTELTSFSNAYEEFEELDTQVIGISVDSPHSHLAWTRLARDKGGVGQLSFPLLSDLNKDISKDFKVLVEDQSDELYGAALRGLFIIDGKGIIRSVQVNDAPVGRSVYETLRLIRAFKHTDLYGDVCPADWTPGDATIIPDHDMKEAYFLNVDHGDL